RIVATEQEPGEIAARLAGGDRDRLEERVEHRGSRDRGPAELGEIPDLGRVTEAEPTVERRQVAGDRPEQRRLAGTIGPHDPDPIAALSGKERGVRNTMGNRRRRAVKSHRPPPGQIADDEVLDPDDDLAGT